MIYDTVSILTTKDDDDDDDGCWTPSSITVILLWRIFLIEIIQHFEQWEKCCSIGRGQILKGNETRPRKKIILFSLLTSDLPLAIQLDMLCGFNFIESSCFRSTDIEIEYASEEKEQNKREKRNWKNYYDNYQRK